MRRLLLAIPTTLIGVGLMAGVANASTVTCSGSISNTGPGSTNTVNCVDTNNVSVSCNNQGVIVENNNQNSTSGSATSGSNTSGGSATSGSSSNSNTVTVQLGASCAAVPGQTTFTTSAVVTPASTSTPAATPTSTPAATPTSLPTTGSSSSLDFAIAGVSAFGGVSLLSAGALTVKRHLQK